MGTETTPPLHPEHYGHFIRPTMQAAPRIAVCTVQADEALSIGYQGTDCIPGLEKRAISICGGRLHRLQHSTLSSTRLKNISSFPSLDGGLGLDPAFTCVLPCKRRGQIPPCRSLAPLLIDQVASVLDWESAAFVDSQRSHHDFFELTTFLSD